jgi:hypothetical protein
MAESRKRRIVRRTLLVAGLTCLLLGAVIQRVRVLRGGTTPVGVAIVFRFHVTAASFYEPFTKSVSFSLQANEHFYDPHLELGLWVGGRNDLECRLVHSDQPRGSD